MTKGNFFCDIRVRFMMIKWPTWEAAGQKETTLGGIKVSNITPACISLGAQEGGRPTGRAGALQLRHLAAPPQFFCVTWNLQGGPFYWTPQNLVKCQNCPHKLNE